MTRARPRWPRTYADAAALARAARPELGDPTTPLGRGDFCLALRAAGGRVVRVARHAEAAAALAREACALAAVADRLPLPVPRPAFAAPAAGVALSVHDEVRGAVLTGARWRRLPAAARDGAAGALAAFLRALHAVPADAVRACGLPALEQRAYAARLRAGAGPLRAALGPAAGDALDAALARWADPAHEAAPAAALVHRDVAPGHVLYDPATLRLAGVIDFGDLALGDPARDLIYLDDDFGADFLAAVLRHYAPGGEGEALRRRMRRWQLLELTWWAGDRLARGRAADAAYGLAELPRRLAVLGAEG